MYWFVYFFQPVLCSFVLFKKWTWPIDGIDKKCASNLALDSPQEQYAKLVTPYVLSFIVKWLSLCDRVTFSEDFTTGCTVESSEGSLSVSSQVSLYFLEKHEGSMLTHICLPRLKRFATFFVEGVDKRWMMSYLRSTLQQKRVRLQMAQSFFRYM